MLRKSEMLPVRGQQLVRIAAGHGIQANHGFGNV